MSKFPLCDAILSGNTEDCLTLIADGATDIEARSEQGLTPLHLAILMGQMDIFKTLLKGGADINAVVDCDSRDAFYFACDSGRTEMALVLMEQVDIHKARHAERRLIHIACACGN